jgi:hypothetical protein
MKLVIVSHVTHYQHGSSICAYGPYAREIDIWADLFAEVVIAAPLRSGEIPPGDCLPLTRKNISIVAQKETGGNNLSAKVAQILALPALISGLTAVMRRADAIHVRCPGNLGLLGLILAPLFSRRLIAKFAGQWNGYPGEELNCSSSASDFAFILVEGTCHSVRLLAQTAAPCDSVFYFHDGG